MNTLKDTQIKCHKTVAVSGEVLEYQMCEKKR